MTRPEAETGEKRYNSRMSSSLAPGKPVFGRAQTFPLRLGWLPKAVRAVGADPKIFAEDAALAEFGVGKNMVHAIRYWAETSGVLQFAGPQAALTEFGEKIFGENGLDPFLEDESTLWLLHWKMTSRPNQFAAGFWLFNRFHKPEFNEKEAAAALVEDMAAAGFALSRDLALRDVKVALHMYARQAGADGFAEENLETPFPALGLIFHNEGDASQHRDENGKVRTLKTYRSVAAARPGLLPPVMAFAVADVFAQTGEAVLQVRESPGGNRPEFGAVFRLAEDDLLEKLNAAAKLSPRFFTLRESAGAWQLLREGASAPDPAGRLPACFAPQPE